MKSKKKILRAAAVLIAAVAVVAIWGVLRKTQKINTTEYVGFPKLAYSERDGAVKAVALSYFTYGCEAYGGISGDVNAILDRNVPGIVSENYGIIRIDRDDPKTAAFDTEAFIRRFIGGFRFLIGLKDENSGFYGAAFCDDENKCVWLSFAGSITPSDNLTCAGFVLNPRFTKQETLAFELYEAVMRSEELLQDGYSLVLTGHSLGGALATEIALAVGCRAITVNGADGMAYSKMRDIIGDSIDGTLVTNYLTNPANGKINGQDAVQRLMFIGAYKSVDFRLFEENGYTDGTHCCFSFLRFPDGDFTNPQLPA